MKSAVSEAISYTGFIPEERGAGWRRKGALGAAPFDGLRIGVECGMFGGAECSERPTLTIRTPRTHSHCGTRCIEASAGQTAAKDVVRLSARRNAAWQSAARQDVA